MAQRRPLQPILAVLLALMIALQPAVAVGMSDSKTFREQPVAQESPPQEAARPDLPTDAPKHFEAPAAPQAGETVFTFDPALRKARFRVDDGWDLDQYLFADSSPLDFYIDLKGFRPSDPARVTLQVYDVDQAGAPGFPECQVELDRVNVNGTYLGNLTGANNQWSTVTFSIPVSALNSGVNHFSIDIDVLTGWCWAVEVGQAEVQIPFNIAMVEASALDDVTIKRGKTDDVISDPVWRTGFDSGGGIITPANPNDPIADKIRGGWFGWGAREFRYKYKIDNWPAGARPTWQPRVSYSWEIPGSGLNSGGYHDLTGWENEFKVTLPDKVGKVTLVVILNIYRDTDLLRTESRSHVLYVLWNQPPNSVAVSGLQVIATAQPRAAWLDIATTWAQNQDTEVNVLTALNTAEYGNPNSWNYYDVSNSPVTLIENTGVNGNCFVFRDVWRVLAASLGISTSSTSYAPGPVFMTKLRPALDGNASANAVPAGGSSPGDRWVFGNHQQGTFGSNFYDPTFGLIGANTTAGKEGNVFCKGLPACTAISPPPSGATLSLAGTTYHTWLVVNYTMLSPRQGSTASLAPLALATFTGSHGDMGYDADGNGLFEHLQVDVGVDVTQAGDFGLVASLTTAGGDLIALGTLDPDLTLSAPAIGATLGTGVQNVSLYFNGRNIRAYGADGPYHVNIELHDQDGALLDTVSFDTAGYSHLAFQGLLIETQSIGDSGVDTDGLPGYNFLRVAVDANMLAAGDVLVQGQLFAGGTFLADVSQPASLSAGAHTLNLDFPGAAIAASGLDGPYTVYLALSDTNYTEDTVYTTAAYSFTAFQAPNALFTGSVSDRGDDVNGNGLYEALEVTAEAVALVPGTYTVHGILQDSAGDFIADGEATAALDGTPVAITLRFPGQLIRQHAVDGPYQVILALTDAAGNDLMSLDYTTSAYAYAGFEQPVATFTGSFADTGVDTNGDGYYNLLRISAGVDVVQAGLYTLQGSLHDGSGSFIGAASTQVALGAGTQAVTLDFDGMAINTHGVDGPYHLLGLQLIAAGNVVAGLLDAHTTTPYAYTDFQPSGVLLTGNFDDYGYDGNGDGLYDYLVVDMELVIAQAAWYYFNARLVDAAGEEITWASGVQYLTPGTRWVSLLFDGRPIYGNGVDGPYYVKDLSIYFGNQFFSVLDAYTTGPYSWQAFARAGVVRGLVQASGQPVPGASVYISGIDSDVSDAAGVYKLTVVNGGSYVIQIDADPALAPWQIWVNGALLATGTSATVPVVVGAATEVNFVSTQSGNLPPVAEANGPYQVDEGMPITLDGSGSSDPDGQIVAHEWDLDADGEYDDATGMTVSATFGDDGAYTVGLRVTDDQGAQAADTADVTVLNVIPSLAVAPDMQTIQYSDQVVEVVFTATDVVADPLLASTSWSADGGAFVPGLPAGLQLAEDGCAASAGFQSCTWTLSGVASVPGATFTVRVAVADDGGRAEADTTIVVEPEDARVTFADGNPVSVLVDAPGGMSGPFSLAFNVSETTPDLPAGRGQPGDIALADVSVSLIPVGPGNTVLPLSCMESASGMGYDARLVVTCSFDDVPVNSYTVMVVVSGDYYAGAAENVLVVYDPSLGFVTGGGWFRWPNTGERTNFGFTMKYGPNGRNVKGSLLVIRHMPDGTIYRIKSNALTGLALSSPSQPFGWASFNGKATYLEPGWPDPIGNHRFVVYVEDRNQPGTGVDRFWIEVRDGAGAVVGSMSMPATAQANAVALQGGNIVVPHGGR